jgi:hypothetical protein
MAGIETSQNFSDGQQVDAASLNGIISNSKLNASAVDGTNITVTGAGQLNLGTVTADKIGTDAVITAKILDSNVTLAKIQNIANDKVLGNTSGSSAAPSELSITDVSNAGFTPTAFSSQESCKLPNGLVLKFGRVSTTSSPQTITFSTAAGETAFSSVISAQVTAEKDTGSVGANVTSFSSTELIVTYEAGTEEINWVVYGT